MEKMLVERYNKVARAAFAFIEGNFYNKEEIWPKFKVGARGGIRPSKQDNLVVVFIDAPSDRKITDFGRNIYADGYDGSKRLYRYTGEGQSGDQEFTRGNKWLRDAAAKGTQIHLFHQNEHGKKHQYIGQVTVRSYT